MADTQYPTDGQLNTSGSPNPLDFRRHREMPDPFTDGAVIPATGDTITGVIPIAGALLVRGRLKFSVAGTLSFRYRRPVGHAGTVYATTFQPPHADVAVVAATETGFDIEPGGESLLAITFASSDGSPGEVTYFDIMQQ